MANYICTTCGMQFAENERPPAACPICTDYRQFVNWEGQQWITLNELRRSHRNILKPEGPGLTGIGTEPRFAIGQRALLVQRADGNVLWDCVSLVDDDTVASIRALGGLSAGDLLASWAAHDWLHLRQIAKRRHELTARDAGKFSIAYAGRWGP